MNIAGILRNANLLYVKITETCTCTCNYSNTREKKTNCEVKSLEEAAESNCTLTVTAAASQCAAVDAST